MFHNLIESSSHARELKRRGSFLLFTVAAYGLLITAGGIASIYAYDAHLEEQSQELTMVTFVPVESKETPPAPVRQNPAPTTASHSIESTRPILYLSTDNPVKVPENVSAKAVAIPPARPDSKIGHAVNDPPLPGGTGNNAVGRVGDTDRPVIVEADPPPPPPVKKHVPQIISKGVITGQALELPKPVYPAMAIPIHLSGQVSVQVLIDETGKVISARAVSGHPILAPGAVRAAYQARFSPTKVGDTPVKVSGIINYNFVLQ